MSWYPADITDIVFAGIHTLLMPFILVNVFRSKGRVSYAFVCLLLFALLRIVSHAFFIAAYEKNNQFLQDGNMIVNFFIISFVLQSVCYSFMIASALILVVSAQRQIDAQRC